MSNFSEIRQISEDSNSKRIRRIPENSNSINSGLMFENIINYGFNRVIAEFIRLDDIKKLGSKYFFETFQPKISWNNLDENRIKTCNNFDFIGIYTKSLPIKYLNKFKLGLQCFEIELHSNFIYAIKNKYDLQQIRAIKCEFALRKYFDGCSIVKSYPKNVKILSFNSGNKFIIDFNLLKNLRDLEELAFYDEVIIENICESTDSPNSKKFELLIKKMTITDQNLKNKDILTYFKSLTDLHVLWSPSINNILNLIYFPKSLITLKVGYDLSELLIYPNISDVESHEDSPQTRMISQPRVDIPFYNFLTNQIKELAIYNCTNEELQKLKSLEILKMYCFNSLVYKLPENVYYLKITNSKLSITYDYIPKYLKLLFDNNQKLRKIKFKHFFKKDFLGVRIKSTVFKLNSREEILQAIQFNSSKNE
jgi:hypothetical protein